jgi:hypothetical protein
MPRLLVRRRLATHGLRIGPALIGLALGTTAGFLLGEFFGPTASRRLARPAPTGRPSMAELVHDAQAALDADETLAALTLEIRPVSRQTVGVHGWVPTRVLRSRADRVVREAIGSDQVVNRILVRGEDDASPPALDVLTA